MKVSNKVIFWTSYLFRFFLAYVFIPHGFEKLTTKIKPQEYIDFGLKGDFLDFYLIWERTGFIWVIGIAQLLGGLLLVFKRTCFFGAIWLFPISIGMFFSHVYISHSLEFLYFDLVILVLNLYLILVNYKTIIVTFFHPQKTWI